MNLFSRAALAAAATVLLSASAFAAATTVTVKLAGEGGGAMKIDLDKTTIPGGDVIFNVANHAMSDGHEMILVKLNSPDEKIPVDTAKHRIDEKQIDALGEVAELKPSGTGTLTATLQPGAYVVLCNIKGHFEAGMATKLTVTN